MRIVLIFLFTLSCCLSPVFAQTMKEAQTALRKQKYDRAVEILDALIASHPEDAKARNLRGHVLVERATERQSQRQQAWDNYQQVQSDAQRAVDDLTAAIKAGIGAKGATATWRGRAYLLLYQHDQALADLNRAIELKPERASAHYYRGLVHRHMGDADAALNDFHTALQYQPQDAEAYRERAKCQEERGLDAQWVPHTQGGITWMEYQLNGIKDPEKIQFALADYERALAVDPDDSESRQRLAHLCALTGDAKRCLEQLEEACRRQPENACNWFSLAQTRSSHMSPEFRDGPKAVAAAQKAIDLSGTESYCQLMTLATAYAEAGEFAKAVSTAKKSLEKLTEKSPFQDKQDDPQRAEIEARLKLFRQKKPYHDPKLRDFTKN